VNGVHGVWEPEWRIADERLRGLLKATLFGVPTLPSAPRVCNCLDTPRMYPSGAAAARGSAQLREETMSTCTHFAQDVACVRNGYLGSGNRTRAGR
jgi:hypothetical protein